MSKLLPMYLQLFGNPGDGEDLNLILPDDGDDVTIKGKYSDEDDAPEGDEEEDNEDVEEEDVDDAEDGEEDETEEDDDTEEDDSEEEDEDKDPDKFTDAQQEKVNEIVKQRLDRQEQKFFKSLNDAAGVDLDVKGGEVNAAVKLWGFLKINPTISDLVQRVVDDALASPDTKQPKYNEPDPLADKAKALEYKEAVLDFKASDAVFAEHYKAIQTWAEENEYPLTDKRSLKLAYLAWRGENSQLLKKALATKELQEQRKAQKQAKSKAKKSAKLETSKPNVTKGKPLDYRKMSNKDILASEGLSLFTED